MRRRPEPTTSKKSWLLTSLLLALLTPSHSGSAVSSSKGPTSIPLLGWGYVLSSENKSNDETNRSGSLAASNNKSSYDAVRSNKTSYHHAALRGSSSGSAVGPTTGSSSAYDVGSNSTGTLGSSSNKESSSSIKEGSSSSGNYSSGNCSSDNSRKCTWSFTKVSSDKSATHF